jgi:hypothetical protein
MAMSASTKLRILSVLDIFKTIGIALLLVFAIQSLRNETAQSQATNQQVMATKAVVDQIKLETQDLKNDNHGDHDTLIKSINCMAQLFGEHPNQYIPRSEFDACLAGTRVGAQLNSSALNKSPASTKTNSNSQNNKHQPNNTNTNTGGQGKQAIRVLGAPACVPFTNLCLTD